MMFMGEMWAQVGSIIASIMFAYAMFEQYFPYDLRRYLSKYTNKIVGYVNPYIQITFHEYPGDGFKHSEVFLAIRNYLSTNSSSRAKRLKAHDIRDSKSLVLSLDDNEEVTDEFQGVKLWWTSYKKVSKNPSFSFYKNPNADEKSYYTLTFHRRHRDLITSSYLNHVVKEGKGIAIKNRQRKLYTNGSSNSWYGKKTKWSHVIFEHPASFNTLAMDPKKKQEIINDLIKFTKGKEYYAKIGKAWKRGYLLYGPPGTGKSTMISAMANFLDYDVYDLELTVVKDNTELRKLLIDTSNKSIIVIEDIDCSLDLTGQRKKEKEKDEDEEQSKDPVRKMAAEEEKNKNKVTLSGLLNFIDGIWSACGAERIIVFTTNYVDKLDPALIRRGRMDKHIELSYCCFEAFKVLARNYLDVESHDLFPKIERLLGETDMTPADVAEYLMPKSDTEDADECLKNLVEALEKTKEDAMRNKAEEEAKLKAEEEESSTSEEESEEEETSTSEEESEEEDVK